MTLDGCRNELFRSVRLGWQKRQPAFHKRTIVFAGYCKCLSCGKTHWSPNKRKYRICPQCTFSKERQAKMYHGKEYRLIASGGVR